MAARTTNRQLVRRIRRSLPPQLEWTEADLALLALADRQAADLDALEARDDLPAIRERRFQRLALVRIVGQVDLPVRGRASALKATRAARARWDSTATLRRVE